MTTRRAVISLPMLVSACAASLTTDEWLTRHFIDNRIQFEKLATMLFADGMTVVHPNWLMPKDKIQLNRWDQYKAIFGQLSIEGGIRTSGGDSVWFLMQTIGFVFGGAVKGYILRPTKPEPMYASLDKRPKSLAPNTRAFKKLTGEWYITYEYGG
jgi:hypothetical protein